MDPSSWQARLPAPDGGIRALALDAVLAPHADIVNRIKLCFGLEPEHFERDILALVRRYAACVHLLPATADSFFSSPGGLLRLGLEVGFFSLQGTDAHIIAGRATIASRRQLEPRWRHATFIAGLCCELHRTPSQVLVTSPQGQVWSPYLQPLCHWLTEHGLDHYQLGWRPGALETRSLGLFVLPQVVPPEVMTYLDEHNTVIVPQLLASVAGIRLYHDHNVLDDLVRRARALVIERHVQLGGDHPGGRPWGAHWEHVLVDAMRRLLRSHAAWTCNQEKSRVWYAQDGLFLLWPGAADDIRKLLEADQLAGAPKSAETLLDLLCAAQLVEGRDAPSALCSLRLPGGKAEAPAIRLRSAAILLAGLHPAPSALQTALLRAVDAPSPAGPPARPQQPGAQLALIEAEPMRADPVPARGGPVAPDAPDAAKAATREAPPRSLALQAPMRLASAVRDALAQVIQTLQAGHAPAQACLLAQGLFVPLDTWEQHGLQPSLVVRALCDAGMLAAPAAGRAATRTQDFNGRPTPGLLIEARFITGLAAAAPAPAGAGDP